MTPRQVFILILRGLGAWQLIDTIEYIGVTYGVHAGTYRLRDSSFEFCLLATGIHFLLAVWLLWFAPLTADLFYKAPSNPARDDETKEL